MRQFITSSDLQFASLAHRCLHQCSVFRDQELPPGSRPTHARIGFEGGSDGSVRLFVDKGVVYSGPSDEIRQWFATGERQFGSMRETQTWIRETLGSCYGTATLPSDVRVDSPDADKPQAPDVGTVTDMDEVSRLIDETVAAHPPIDPDALFAVLTRHVRGQPGALHILSTGAARHLGQTHPRRPATFFAVGPTGVGKTTAAEALARALTESAPKGGQYAFMRLDMSEYQERHRVSQLIGAPQGYVGYGEGAQLLDHLAAHKRSIVLFDEIEKAHPDILMFLMNAIDAGRISTPRGTGHGYDIDCRQAIFFFTSNLESAGIAQDLEQHGTTPSAATVNAVCRRRLRQAGIRPEILGRIGAFLSFSALTRETRTEVIALSVQRVAAQYGVVVDRVDPEVIVAVYSALEDDDFGARPVEQLVDEMIGPLFASETRHLRQSPVVVKGPPFILAPAVQGPGPATERLTDDSDAILPRTPSLS